MERRTTLRFITTGEETADGHRPYRMCGLTPSTTITEILPALMTTNLQKGRGEIQIISKNSGSALYARRYANVSIPKAYLNMKVDHVVADSSNKYLDIFIWVK